MSFHVRPRYSCGSPALVDRAIALRVVNDERRAIEADLKGYHGVPAQELAQRLGLANIVYHLREHRGGWTVTDLLTGEQYRRSFSYREGDQVEVWDAKQGWQLHIVHKSAKQTHFVVVRPAGQEVWQQTPVEVGIQQVRVPFPVEKLTPEELCALA
jgi:hypothetical protein